MMKHLLEGVKKGAFDQAAAEQKFQAWKQNKQSVLHAVKEQDREATKAAVKVRLEEEKAINKAKAEEVAKKKAEAAAEAAAAEAPVAEEVAPAEEAPAAESAE